MTAQFRRFRHAELIAAKQHEGTDLGPISAKGQRALADGILAPVAGIVARDVIHAYRGVGTTRAIIPAEGKNCFGCTSADGYAGVLGASLRDLRQFIGQEEIQTRGLRDKERRQGIMHCLGNGCMAGGPRGAGGMLV